MDADRQDARAAVSPSGAAASGRMPRPWRLLIVAILIFAASAIGVFTLIIDRHMKLQGTAESIANAALRTAMEFQDLQTAARVLVAAPTAENLDAVRLTYDILYGRLDTMTVGVYGSVFSESEAVGQLIRSLKQQIVDLAPLVDGLDIASPALAATLSDTLATLEQPIARFSTGNTQRQARANDEARQKLIALYSVLGALFAAMVAGVGVFVWLLVRQFRQISASNAELRRLSTQLAEAKLDADAASQAKSHFLAVMSHELRTPLNAILGFSEIIGGELFGPVGERRYGDYARDIHRSGTHLLSLVNDILDLSKIEAGRYQLLEERLSIGELADGCIKIVRANARAGVSVTHGDFAAVPQLFADGRALRQMIFNLLTNAVKFTLAPGVVHLSAGLGKDGGLCLTVEDTGVGMAESDIQAALVPFNQVNSHVAREQKGAGLGLSITKRLIELHGGSLRIASTVGKGTKVTLAFPAGRVVAANPRDLAA